MLENFLLLQSLPSSLLQELERVCELKVFPQGTRIIEEGDQGTEILFPVSGRMEYSARDQELGQDVKFHEVDAACHHIAVGEMSSFSGEPRSCSIDAATDVVAHVLHFDQLKEKSEHADEIIEALRHQVTLQISDNLRNLNSAHVGTLREQVKQLQQRNYYGSVFIVMAAILALTSLAAQAFADFLPNFSVGETPLFVWVLVLLLSIPAAILVAAYKVPVSEVGLRREKLISSTLEGLLFIGLTMGVILGALWVVDAVRPESTALAGFLTLLSRIDLVASLHYLPNSFLQEFAARGVTQTAFQKFFTNRSGFMAVLMTSIFFSVGHMPYGLLAVLVTFVGSIVLGAFYLRSHNLAGVTLMHYFFGGVLFEAGMI